MDLKRKIYGCIGKAQEVEKEISVYAMENPLWYIPWRASKGGVFSGCPPEIMHQFELGLMKSAFKWIWEFVKDRSKNLFNQRFIQFNGRRECDPMLHFVHYTAGTKDLSGTEAKEYLGLILQSIVAIGINKTILNSPTDRIILKALSLLALVHHLLWEERERLDDDIMDIRTMVPVMMENYRKAFERNSKTKCGYYKFHATHHLATEMEKFGSMQIMNSSAGESMNREVKKRFRKSSKKKRSQNEEMFYLGIKSELVDRVVNNMDFSTLLSADGDEAVSNSNQQQKRYRRRKMRLSSSTEEEENYHELCGERMEIPLSDFIKNNPCPNLVSHGLNIKEASDVQHLILQYAKFVLNILNAEQDACVTAHSVLKIKDLEGKFRDINVHAQMPKSRAEKKVIIAQEASAQRAQLNGFDVKKLRRTELDVVYNTENNVLCAGRVIMFLEIESLSNKRSSHAALLHRFQTVKGAPEEEKYKLESPRYSIINPNVLFSYMKLEYLKDGSSSFHIIDTDDLITPCWTQCDLDNPENTWFIRFWNDHKAQCSLFLTRGGLTELEEVLPDDALPERSDIVAARKKKRKICKVNGNSPKKKKKKNIA